MKPTYSSERGQIIVIFAVALVALLAFTALAIDGGMIFADRRQSQSSADAASLAGAGAAAQYMEQNGVTYDVFSCSNPKVGAAIETAYTAALNRAGINQLVGMDRDVSDKHGVEVICVNDDANFNKYIDVHVEATSSVTTSFLQIFFSGAVKNTVNALTRTHPRTELAYGRAIVSLSDSCGTNTGGVVFDGTSDVYITGGGVYSNSCIDASGNVTVDVSSGGIAHVGDLTTNGHPSLSPAPNQSGTPLPRQAVPTPACGSGAAISSTGDGTINPGNYSKIKLTNGTLHMNPGLYCIAGDVDVQGGEILGDGVTFYLQKDGSKDTSMLINGGATAHLKALTATTSGNNAIVGILIYMAEGNNGSISLLGGSGSSFVGEVYAPDGKIDVGGNSGLNPTYNTQLVGKYVKVHGNSEIRINFLPSPLWTEQPQLDLLE